MKKYWVIVRVWCGVADRVWLYDDDSAAYSDYNDLKEKENIEKEDIQIFELEL